MLRHACVLVLLAACGADGSAPPPTQPRPAPVAVDHCRRACERQASCLPAGYADHDPTACLADCRANLESRDPKDPGARPKVLADCLVKFSCTDIEKSMSMNMGPAGYCYSQAIN